MEIEQILHELKQVQNDPQAMVVATAKIVCDPLHQELFGLLKTASMPHWFNQEMVSIWLNNDAELTQTLFRLLISLPMVEEFPTQKAWNVHEKTRKALRADLFTLDKERFNRISQGCVAYFVGLDAPYHRIEQIYHRLAANEPEADKNLLDLFYQWERTGNYDARQTLAYILEELIQEGLLEGSLLARTLIVFCWIRGSRFPIGKINEYARQALTLFKESQNHSGEADAHDLLGQTLVSTGNLLRALDAYHAAMAIRKGLCGRDPDNTDWLRDLSVSHYLIADVFEIEEKLNDALGHLEACFIIAQKLASIDPDNSTWRQDFEASESALNTLKQRILTGQK
jgi:tetratricopeptide (TPR) repeat protein